jgi:hypothetical protein
MSSLRMLTTLQRSATAPVEETEALQADIAAQVTDGASAGRHLPVASFPFFYFQHIEE